MSGRAAPELCSSVSDPDSDVAAIFEFSLAMADKMFVSHQKGRSGWRNCPVDDLWAMLREHVEKGDVVDVANFCMMIYHNTKGDENG